MKLKFNGCTIEEKERIKKLVCIIKTKLAKDLLVRISMHRAHVILGSDGIEHLYYRSTRRHGYYRNIFDHGMYQSEWDNIYKKKDCAHIIQLHLRDNESDYSIAHVFAHEYRHYLQYTKLRNKFVIKHKRRELDARKWADKRLNKIGIKNDVV